MNVIEILATLPVAALAVLGGIGVYNTLSTRGDITKLLILSGHFPEVTDEA